MSQFCIGAQETLERNDELSPARPSLRRPGFTLIELLVVIAIIAILVAMLLPAVQQVREAARKSQCQDHLHNLAIAMHNYDASHKVYPYGHQTEYAVGMHRRDCWYQRILPFIEQKPLYDLYEADNTQYVHQISNNNIRQASPDLLNCPSQPNIPGRGGNGGTAAFQGSYGVCAGVGVGKTVDRATGIITVATDAARDTTGTGSGGDPGGMFYRNSKTNTAACTDGTSNTLYFSEGVIRGNTVSAWGELGGYWGGAPHGSFGFSTAEVPNTPVPDRNYSCKMTLYPPAPNQAPCQNGNADGLTGRWNFARSFHPGGVQAALGDGKVHFFSDNIDRNTWMRLGMREDSLPVKF